MALVCDWLTNAGGAEKVVETLAEIWPEAPIYTSVYKPGVFGWAKDKKIFTSWLNKIPFLKYKHQLFSLFRPMAFENFDLSKYDIVISSASAEAKNIITKPETVHICYCHTPTRYFWSDYHDYLGNRMEFGWFNGIVKWLMPGLVNDLRQQDRLAANRVDFFVANSQYVRRRIWKYYRREAKVIYPPVELVSEKLNIGHENSENYYLFISRLVPYKKADLVVSAFVKNGKKLKVVGDGPQKKIITNIAKGSSYIEILGRVDDNEKKKLLNNCRALIFPAEEDFGIVPLEAMSYGKPVLAFGRGGAIETVLEGKTGHLFYNQDVDSLNIALGEMEKMNFDWKDIRKWAHKFAKSRFKKEIMALVYSLIKEKTDGIKKVN